MEVVIPLTKSTLSIPWWQYWLYVLLLSALVRGVLTFFKSFRLAHESGRGVCGFFCYFFRIFVGLSHGGVSSNLTAEEKERVRGDYLTAYVLGALELAAYPFLFAANLYPYVGAWIGLKVVAQYKHWTDERGLFTAFLVGNALVLILAFICLHGYVATRT